MNKFFMAAVAATAIFAGAANAATVSSNWHVVAINAKNINRADSAATESNFETALAAANNGTAGYTKTQFNYSGELNFAATDRTVSTTIADWFATGTPGGVDGLNASFGGLQLSRPNINTGTATTTFFKFLNLGTGGLGAGDLTITHDDGILVYDNVFAGTTLGGSAGPNSVRETQVEFGGNFLHFLYVASNGNPSVLNVDLEVTPVPLPASFPLMLVGLGGMVALRRRQRS